MGRLSVSARAGLRTRLATAAGPVVMVLGAIVGAIASLGVIIGVIVGGPAGLVIAGIGFAMAFWVVEIVAATAAMVGLLYYFFGAEGLKAGFDYVWKSAQAFFVGTIGFMMNFQHNMGALTNWLWNNWDAVLTDMMTGMLAFLKNMVSNNFVALRTVFRLFVAFGGWVVGMLGRVFTYDFVKAVYLGLGKGLNAFVQFAINAKDILLSIFSGKSPEESLRAFMDMIVKDFGEGMANANFLETAGGILKEEMGNLRFTEGMFTEMKKRGGPDFAYGWGEKTAKSYAEGVEAGAPAIARAVDTAMAPLNKNSEETTALLDSLDKESLREAKNVERLTEKLQEQAATYGMNTAQM